METNQTKKKILEILEEKGPSLPINIAKQIGMNSLFISAFLSELTSEKRIKTSSLKVGGSPLYYLEGQEEQLEPFYKYMHPKEAETFLLLKKNKILKDNLQEPATRVALRSIRDFAIGFKQNEEIYWRHHIIPEEEAIKIINPLPVSKITIKSPKQKIKISKENISEPEKKDSPDKEDSKSFIKKSLNKIDKEFQNPLISEDKKSKPKSDFINKTICFLKENNLEIKKEEDYKAKEYNCIIQIKSQLGLINFLTQAKDKKTITETDMKKLLSNSQKIPLPAFLLYTGTISKKAQEYIENYSSILKAVKIK